MLFGVMIMCLRSLKVLENGEGVIGIETLENATIKYEASTFISLSLR